LIIRSQFSEEERGYMNYCVVDGIKKDVLYKIKPTTRGCLLIPSYEGYSTWLVVSEGAGVWLTKSMDVLSVDAQKLLKESVVIGIDDYRILHRPHPFCAVGDGSHMNDVVTNKLTQQFEVLVKGHQHLVCWPYIWGTFRQRPEPVGKVPRVPPPFGRYDIVWPVHDATPNTEIQFWAKNLSFDEKFYSVHLQVGRYYSFCLRQGGINPEIINLQTHGPDYLEHLISSKSILVVAEHSAEEYELGCDVTSRSAVVFVDWINIPLLEVAGTMFKIKTPRYKLNDKRCDEPVERTKFASYPLPNQVTSSTLGSLMNDKEKDTTVNRENLYPRTNRASISTEDTSDEEVYVETLTKGQKMPDRLTLAFALNKLRNEGRRTDVQPRNGKRPVDATRHMGNRKNRRLTQE